MDALKERRDEIAADQDSTFYSIVAIMAGTVGLAATGEAGIRFATRYGFFLGMLPLAYMVIVKGHW